MNGIDVSSWQNEIDWKAVKDSGKVEFVFAKATEGTDNVDSQFIANHTGCKEAGITFGAYHFFHFGQDPEEQARHFLATISGYEGTLLPMVDVEGGGQDGVTNLATLTALLSAFLRVVEASLGGKKCIIYSDYGDWNGFMQGTDAFSGHPFFVAEYNSDAEPTLPNGFSDWALWQYTSSGQIPGISGNVDCDRLNSKHDIGAIER